MRDDRQRWTAPGALATSMDLDGATLERVAPPRQSLVSGPGIRTASTLPLIGWPDIAPQPPYRITLRRDRVVEVGGPPGAEGWNSDRNEAFSDITAAYTILDLAGPRAFDILKRGTEISHDIPSASVVRKLFGLDVWLYRADAEDRYRLHIVHALGEALIGHLVAAAQLSRA